MGLFSRRIKAALLEVHVAIMTDQQDRRAARAVLRMVHKRRGEQVLPLQRETGDRQLVVGRALAVCEGVSQGRCIFRCRGDPTLQGASQSL